MEYEWDETKNAANRREHGIDFSLVEIFNWDFAQFDIDDREDYGELREIATGYIGDVLHVLIFTDREEVIRVISLRKANKKERRAFGQRAR